MRIVAASENLIAKIVNGSACGNKNLAPMNPVLHRNANTSGMVRFNRSFIAS